jgi:hypothetical protein
VEFDSSEEQHSSVQRQVLDFDSKGGAFTTAWVMPSDNSIGVKLRTADTTYSLGFAFGSAGDNSYRDNEYSLVSVWHVTAASVLKGRLGRPERKFDQGGDRDFSGPTWRFGYEWEPTGKTALEAAVWRELTGFEDLSGNYMRTTGIGLFPAWSVMPKLILQAKAAYQTRAYLGDVLTASGVPREDQEKVFQIAAVWTPLRMTKLILAIETGDRNSNQPLADYEFHSVGLAAIRTF